MSKPIAFIVVEGGQTWLRTTAETEEDIRTGFINETIPLYKQREPLSYKHLEALVDKYHGYPMTLGRAIEKAHGITGVDDE